MKLILVYCLSVVLFLILSSCDTNEPLPQGAVGLTLEDVSCTEAWITLTTGNLSNTAYIKIMSNDKLLQTLDVSATKTLLYYDTLQPNTNYEFQAFSSQRGEDIIGNKLQVNTLDTTSHNFAWQTFEFGQHSSSVLYDVAIIDENNIWAVGEIYMNDSLGNPDPNAYNAIHWNGASWELNRIMFYTICGQQSRTPYPAKAIWAFNENEIWIAMDGDQIAKLENEIQVITMCLPWSFSINKIWGSSSNDLYLVGSAGNIAHYNGSWTKIESGTTSDIQDIWGNIDPITQSYKLLAVAYSPGETRIFTINSNSATDTLNWSVNKGLGSIWFDKFHLFVSGSGVWKNKNNVWEKMNGVPDYFLNTIRGDKINNLFAVGWTVRMVHYNGVEWNEMPGIPEEFNFESVAVKGNKVVAVGFSSSGGLVGKAVIYMGSR